MPPSWTPSSEQRSFIKRYAKALASGDAALFAGAGLSRSAGYVDWKGLLKDIAEDLKLDLDRETDLIAIAQYHLNTKRNRSRLNQSIIDELNRSAETTPSHSVIARLPVRTIWTTNYDRLLEQAFEAGGKVVDVKVSEANLAQIRRGHDVVVYKMHGCVSHPHEAVVTKDDYEQYETHRPLFTQALKGDLVRKTFLFLGFSFTDPNVDYILSRVRVLLGTDIREHFSIMRRPERPRPFAGKARAEYEYQQRVSTLRQDDLHRFGIETVLVDDFESIPKLLGALSDFLHRKSVFISGAAHDSGPLGQPRLETLAREIGGRLIRDGYNVVSGFGLGLGEQCIIGALKALYGLPKDDERDRVTVRPFPRASSAAKQATENTRHREELLGRSGIVIVLAGNRLSADGTIEESPGVIEEVDIATRAGKIVIPIGATGHAARRVWERSMKDPQQYLPRVAVGSDLRTLGDLTASNHTIIRALFRLLDKAARSRSL